ncbi:hypothetical protein BBJ28_00012906 [Nothophytophthora sp. Chile5]|nr:hypothetical protein BBJ28_00012906 [Nothophytophthora sp. Chile5]
MRLLDAFLDGFSDTLTLARGYLLSDGSLRLLQYLAAHERPTTDPVLRRWAFNDVVGYAVAKGGLETLQWLLDSYMPDEFLTKAVAEAASGGHLHVLEYLWANYRSRGYWGATEMGRAVRNKHSAVVAWLRDHTVLRPEFAVKLVRDAVCCGDLATLQWLIEHFDVDTSRALIVASRQDQWDMVRWMIENCELVTHLGKPYSKYFDLAAGDGNLEFLKFATSRKLWTPSARDASWMISSAAAAGHLDVVKWLHEELDTNSADDGYVNAAMGGHLEVLKYLHEKHLRNGSKQSPMDMAAKGGFLDVVQWLHENRREGCTSAAMHHAAVNGHMDVVKWLHSHRREGCKKTTLVRAAGVGNLEMVQWLHDNRRDVFFGPGAMDRAATWGHLDVVKWLHESRGERCSVEAMNGAAACGFLEVVKWLHENRSEGCTKEAMDIAAANGHLKIVQWLHENRHEGCSVKAMNEAAVRGHLDVVKWLHENRTEGCTKWAMHAASYDHFKVVKWLCRNRSEGCTPDAIKGAIRKGLLDIAAYLHTESLECRKLEMTFPLWLSRIEEAEWVLGHFPREFRNCYVVAKPGDWYFDDWVQRTRCWRTRW